MLMIGAAIGGLITFSLGICEWKVFLLKELPSTSSLILFPSLYQLCAYGELFTCLY